jgi:pyruvate ferredoxin oxidoreductase gamma subunit
MFRIRFHGRGGQGMKTASRILGTAFFREGFEVQDAPRYGAERRGAPIFAYVRAAREPIHERGVITRPDLVIVADDSLIAVPAAGVLPGIGDATVLLFNSSEAPDVWKDRLELRCRILTLPLRIAVERAQLPFIGAACAGAAAKAHRRDRANVSRRQSAEVGPTAKARC